MHGGKGPPVLLLHGNPFTHLSWHKFAPRLAQEFTVVATDLRGYGDSSKPPGGENHENYSFRAMAQDQIEVMEQLGFKTFMVAGHDRGARVTHRMCLDHPERVQRAAILDIIPQHHLFTQHEHELGQGVLSLVLQHPARADAGDADERRSGFVHQVQAHQDQAGLSFFGKEAMEEYKRCFRNPETIHAICEDYRATYGVDFDMDTGISTPARRSPARR